MSASEDVDYLLRRAQQETQKAAAAMERGESMLAVYAHRELATRYQATASVLIREMRTH